MSISRLKVWAAEALLHADLNAEFNNILSNPIDLWSPAGKAASMNTFALYFDSSSAVSLSSAGATSGLALIGAALNTPQGANIASASTINLDTATGNLVDVTGTTTITAVTLSQGRWRIVRHTGIQTITHGASLVLPNAANYTTAAGDYVLYFGYTSSVVRAVPLMAWLPLTGGTLTGGLTVGGALSATTITGSGALSVTNATLNSTDAGVVGPTLTLYHNSASPAAADFPGVIVFKGKDSGGNDTTYADILGRIVDPNDGSEDGEVTIRRMVAGTLTEGWGFRLGLYTTNATGGDQGLDTINCKGYYKDGVAIPDASATQADMEAAASTTAIVSPGRLKFSPSAAKVWGQCGTTGNLSSPSLGVSSITDTGTGRATVVFSTNFSSVVYSFMGQAVTTSTATITTTIESSTIGVGSSEIRVQNCSDGTFADPVGYSFMAFGDQ